MNNCDFVGRLTRDPELRSTQTGKNVVSFGVAINEGKDKVTFIDVTAWEAKADLIKAHFGKGDGIGLSCRVQNDNWEDNEGNKRSKCNFVVKELFFLPGASKAKQEDEGASDVPVKTPKVKTTKSKATAPVGVSDDGDDDLPF